MARLSVHAMTDSIDALFGAGTVAGLSDQELLERFLSAGGGPGMRELAFEALVTRHGPMVMRICQGMLDDPHDSHDAFQAVFLVLARRARTIRKRGSLASWLHGVARRVAQRCRAGAIRRQVRVRRSIAAAQAVAADREPGGGRSALEQEETALLLHAEISRLPEKYRAPIVLCYLEGLTHDEASAHLSWPVGTVRSRLSRARDALRRRLERRGSTTLSSLGVVGTWLLGETAEATTPASIIPVDASGFISRELAASVARSACQFGSGRSTVVASSSAGLAHGVLNSMILKKMLVAACALISLGLMAAGGGLLIVRRVAGQSQGAASAPAAPGAAAAQLKKVPKPPEIDPLIQQLLEAARKRFDAQRAYYEEGRITLDRFLDASKQLAVAEARAATTDVGRVRARERHLERARAVEDRERAEVAVGRGTEADLAEARQGRLEAEFELKLARSEAVTNATILRRLDDLERKVDQLQKMVETKAPPRG